MPMLEYFKTWYIGNRKADSHLRLKPAFHEMWSVFFRTLEEFVRTNNNIEAWHKQFEIDCKKHPTLSRLLSQFILEQKHTDILLAQIDSCGDEYESRDKKDILKDKRLKQICSTYKETDISTFKTKIAEVVKTISK